MAGAVTYRPALPDDAMWLAPRLRAADVAEIWAASGQRPDVALARSLDMSAVAVCAEVAGEPAAIFGVVPLSPMAGEAAPWMLATDAADRHARAWLKEAPQWLTLLGDGWSVLRNHVDARNVASIRWLRRMGFEIAPAVAWGWAGAPFHPFKMEVRHV